MKEKQLRTFIINEKEMIFNQKYFKEAFLKYASQKSIGIGDYEYEVAEALYVDKSAVHNWRMGVNGPGDIEKIQLLANLWNIKYELLLKEVNVMNTTLNNKKLTDREKDSLKRVYSSLINYLKLFDKTSGFIWNEDGSDFDMRLAYVMYDQTKAVLEMEYIDLKRTVYDQLNDFFDHELTCTLESCYLPEEGDYPELKKAETLGMYMHLMDSFKLIVDSYLV